jgi:tRNA-dihydrouridine synthase B
LNSVTFPAEISSPVLLAPMAGITDLPFRTLVASFGAAMVVSEMVASRDMLNARPGSRERAELGLGADATAVQLAGCEAEPMAEAARMVEAQGAKVIDINMGCPAKKVTQGAAGSALMRRPDHALRLIEAVVQEVSVPVTLKTRLGWNDETRNAPEIARLAEAAGVRMITIHGRTRCQFYKGAADWKAIAAVKKAVSIPVVANGDIVCHRSARAALAQSGADGVMIGRGARGKPWRLAQISHALFGTPAPKVPERGDFVRMVQAHHEEMIRFYGRELGLRVARKHLGWYMDHCDTPADLRREVLTAADVRRTHSLIEEACGIPVREAA